MNFKKIIIDRFAAYLLSGKLWKIIQQAVSIVESPELSGAQKRQAVLDMLEHAGIELAGWLINLGIELAVAKLRSSANG